MVFFVPAATGARDGKRGGSFSTQPREIPHQAVIAYQSDTAERAPLAENNTFDGRMSVVSGAGDREFVEGATRKPCEPATTTRSW